MNREDIIRLRDECDEWAENHLQCKGEYHPDFHTVSDERFAALVAAAAIKDAPDYKMGYADGVAAEREACYELTDSRCQCGGLIQSRGNT